MASAALEAQLVKPSAPILLPARAQTLSHRSLITTAQLPDYNLLSWTFGRGSVVWRIWPAVLLHTLFAAGIVTITMRTKIDLAIPNVLLTVLGVVIGFVISYRAMSGYDRYWMGRTCWSEIMRNSRTMGRLVWFHVPPRVKPKQPNQVDGTPNGTDPKEVAKVMREKHIALDLVEGFSVALKHHVRGELGIYYEDLYHLVKPLHDHTSKHNTRGREAPSKSTDTTTNPNPQHQTSVAAIVSLDPIIPPINSYGTFLHTGPSSRPHFHRSNSTSSSHSGHSSDQPLLPSSNPSQQGVLSSVSGDLIPFFSVFTKAREFFDKNITSQRQTLEVLPPGLTVEAPNGERQWAGPTFSKKLRRGKHRPRIAGDGQNLPLEVLRCLSEWCSVLEDRGTVPGTSLGSMLGCISAFEDNLSTLERILTTPLPFVYSVHIKHTVWIYLFFLPFQLVGQFEWYTIPGVGIAAFIYLGFLAAGEEIEQPFGYDENDLDLDLFCHEIIHPDIVHLKSSPCLNAVISEHAVNEFGGNLRTSMTLVDEEHGHGEGSAFDGL